MTTNSLDGVAKQSRRISESPEEKFSLTSRISDLGIRSNLARKSALIIGEISGRVHQQISSWYVEHFFPLFISPRLVIWLVICCNPNPFTSLAGVHCVSHHLHYFNRNINICSKKFFSFIALSKVLDFYSSYYVSDVMKGSRRLSRDLSKSRRFFSR